MRAAARRRVADVGLKGEGPVVLDEALEGGRGLAVALGHQGRRQQHIAHPVVAQLRWGVPLAEHGPTEDRRLREASQRR